MGVINLGLLVDKIKKKLENSGFIKNTDYASASAAGVIKAGDGLSVNATTGVATVPKATADSFGIVKPGSGISIAAGVISAAGGSSLTKIGELASPVTGTTADITCSQPITGFQMLLIWNTNNDNQAAATILPVADFVANAQYRTLVDTSNSGAIANGYIYKKAGDTTDTIVTVEAKSGMKFKTLIIYGI